MELMVYEKYPIEILQLRMGENPGFIQEVRGPYS